MASSDWGLWSHCTHSLPRFRRAGRRSALGATQAPLSTSSAAGTCGATSLFAHPAPSQTRAAPFRGLLGVMPRWLRGVFMAALLILVEAFTRGATTPPVSWVKAASVGWAPVIPLLSSDPSAVCRWGTSTAAPSKQVLCTAGETTHTGNWGTIRPRASGPRCLSRTPGAWLRSARGSSSHSSSTLQARAFCTVRAQTTSASSVKKAQSTIRPSDLSPLSHLSL